MLNIKDKKSSLDIFKYLTIVILILLNSPIVSAATDSGQTTQTPWSGYWWPTNSGGLANGYGNFGHPGPIEKYELYTIGNYPGDATQWELDNYYDPSVPSWYGQCNAWAAAASFEVIQFYPSVIDNIVFRVGDKKGLITSCHWDDPAIRMSGGGSPHIFHEWLLYYVKERGKPFVADLGGESEAWFYPIFKYEMKVLTDGSVAHVECQVWYADDHVHPDFQGTKVQASIKFYYDLYINGNGEITGGEWTGISVNNHPKSFFFPLSAQPKSPYLDYKTIREIAVHKDDDIESDETVRLPPGTYNLILLNQDKYMLPCKKGDILRFTFDRLDELDNKVSVNIVDASGISIKKIELIDTVSLYSVIATTPPYTIIVDSDDYSNGNIYQVVFDINREGEQIFPEIQKGNGWNGYSLTNSNDSTCRNVMAIAYDQSGRPVKTAYGPVDIGPFKKASFCLSNSNIRKHEEKDLFSLKMLSESPISAMYLGGVPDDIMAGIGVRKQNNRFVIPDTTTMFNVNKYVTWDLYNAFSYPISLTLTLYDEQGIRKKQIAKEIAGFSLEKYIPSSNPFNSQIDNGWILVECDFGLGIDGFIKWHKDGQGIAESLYALTSIGKLFYVPHIATAGMWKTEVTLINLSTESDNNVTCIYIGPTVSETEVLTLFAGEKRTINLSNIFSSLNNTTLNKGALVISSQKDLNGYFSYNINSSKASFELLSEASLSNIQVLPHIASNNYWWTGVALFNPQEKPSTALLIPYDHQGKLMQDHLKYETIPPLTKKVACIKNLFNTDIVGNISWIKIQSDGDGVMGLSLYGDTAFNILSGSVLYPKN